MRGMIGGMMSGGVVSALALGVASVVSEQPAGVTPPEAPLIEAPAVAEVAPVEAEAAVAAEDGPSTPVGSVTIEEPQAPALPEGEASAQEPVAPSDVSDEPEAPRADTDPLDEPEVVSVEGAMAAPEVAQEGAVAAEPDAPVLPNPQSMAPAAPVGETNVTVSTAPAQPVIVEEVEEAPTQEGEEFFVVDLGAQPDDAALADEPAPEEPRLQLQGGENTLLADRETGVTVRRPGSDDAGGEPERVAEVNALADFAAASPDTGGVPLMSILLIDDGSMTAASAALAGLPFPVTIVLDPSASDANAMMQAYRADGFEVAVLAKLPEGALPSDVEVTLQSVFQTVPEGLAVLDLGAGGFQSDRAVTEQAMEVLAASGRGFVSASQGLNMAGRAAEQAGVPSAVVFRDVDGEDQDARVVRRFVDQAAFRARQESGVILVGRVRPDTISALILWATANQDGQVALVPVSSILSAE